MSIYWFNKDLASHRFHLDILFPKNGGNMSITSDQGMLGFRVLAKDVKMETVAGKVNEEQYFSSVDEGNQKILRETEQ
jgi:hypothetical protein